MRYASRIEALSDKSLLNAFEVIETPDMISFSAGFPSPETYPLEAIRESFDHVMEESGKEALSYGSTSGYIRLREIIGNRLAEKFDLHYNLEEIMDMSFAVQCLSALYVKDNYTHLENKVIDVSAEIDGIVAERKLASWGIAIDRLTPDQEKYLNSWEG